MSYILDALKKADAQRERDPARGIHAQPAPLPTLQQPGVGERPWFWVAVAAGIAAVAAALWLLTQERSELPRPPATMSNATPPRGAPVPAAAPAPLGSPAAAPEPAAAAVLPPPAPLPPPVIATAQGKGAAPTGESAPRAAPATKASPASVSSSTPVAAAPAPAAPPVVTSGAVTAPGSTRAAAPPPAAAPAAPAAPIEPAIANGLPPDAPKLAISGGVYSTNRAQRMLIVNGQVVNEGADLGGGIVLEEIRPKAAVLRFRGGRYNVAF